MSNLHSIFHNPYILNLKWKRLPKPRTFPLVWGHKFKLMRNKNKVFGKPKRECNLYEMSCMCFKRKWDFCPKPKTNFLLKSLNDSNTFENDSNTFENDSNTFENDSNPFENNLNYFKKKIDFRRRKKGTKKIKKFWTKDLKVRIFYSYLKTIWKERKNQLRPSFWLPFHSWWRKDLFL